MILIVSKPSVINVDLNVLIPVLDLLLTEYCGLRLFGTCILFSALRSVPIGKLRLRQLPATVRSGGRS